MCERVTLDKSESYYNHTDELLILNKFEISYNPGQLSDAYHEEQILRFFRNIDSTVYINLKKEGYNYAQFILEIGQSQAINNWAAGKDEKCISFDGDMLYFKLQLHNILPNGCVYLAPQETINVTSGLLCSNSKIRFNVESVPYYENPSIKPTKPIQTQYWPCFRKEGLCPINRDRCISMYQGSLALFLVSVIELQTVVISTPKSSIFRREYTEDELVRLQTPNKRYGYIIPLHPEEFSISLIKQIVNTPHTVVYPSFTLPTRRYGDLGLIDIECYTSDTTYDGEGPSCAVYSMRLTGASVGNYIHQQLLRWIQLSD